LEVDLQIVVEGALLEVDLHIVVEIMEQPPKLVILAEMDLPIVDVEMDLQLVLEKDLPTLDVEMVLASAYKLEVDIQR
jgi:hypothetical protein